MAEIFKSLSTLGIRLSVELVKSDLTNLLKIVPVTSADRPCMFFIMGEGVRIVQKVRSVFTSCQCLKTLIKPSPDLQIPGHILD